MTPGQITGFLSQIESYCESVIASAREISEGRITYPSVEGWINDLPELTQGLLTTEQTIAIFWGAQRESPARVLALLMHATGCLTIGVLLFLGVCPIAS